jgi:5-methylcytosine-specific restriction enzyme A
MTIPLENAMPGWNDSNRRSRLPANWNAIRRSILRAANNRCEASENGIRCNATANQVDHIVAGDNHSAGNLQALCEEHHAVKSSSEGGFARAEARREVARRLIRPSRNEKHPGAL